MPIAVEIKSISGVDPADVELVVPTHDDEPQDQPRQSALRLVTHDD